MIYTKARTSGDPKPLQEPTFSTCGPNNQDHAIQGTYGQTQDDAYIQATSKGEIIAFGAKNGWADSQLVWAHTFKDNMCMFCILSNVAVYLTYHSAAVLDVLQSPSRY